ncbi:hypothetical protein RISK_003328 [Rhodopirellula islandica]|uniref:Uncharacterized protein n=1 Tax=Rhodopirellula islandica TaxID=595434 RepID=A0A0J1BDX4_RHOIS|nr:hypothetical protein [Rhodopirellula islandica]KLU04706.1 hypothetical protein RISK_003328 [Rhodopirellula islandica]
MVMAVALAESAVVPSDGIGNWARCSGQVPLTAPANSWPVAGERSSIAAALPPATSFAMTPDQARQSVQWLADQLLQHVPDHFDGDDDWGNTKSVWAGVKVRREGWKLKTNRRRRDVRHGRWVRYDISLPELAELQRPISTAEPALHPPSGRAEHDLRSPADTGLFSALAWPSTLPLDPAGMLADSTLAQVPLAQSPLTIRSVVPSTTPAGNPGWLVDAVVRTPAKFHTRLERWNLGLQAFSISVDGTMEVNLECQFVIGMSADYSEVPPAIQLDVHVAKANVRMDRFNVERISKLGGDAAEELGNLAEDTLIRLWLKKENARLADRLNDAIAKHQSDLRWSMMQWLGQWHSASLPLDGTGSATR